MQKRKLLISTCSVLFILSLLVNVQYVAATSRGDLLGDLLVINQTGLGGFRNSNSTTNSEMNTETTYANLFVLEKLDRLDDIDKEQAQGWLVGEMDAAVLDENITELFYGYKSYLIANGTYNATEKDDVAEFLIELQSESNYGFASGYALEENIADTYFAIELLFELGHLDDIVQDNVAQFLLDKWDANLGGFVQGTNEIISIVDTYYALACLNRLGSLNLENAQSENITSMIAGYYVSEENYDLHLGGYSYLQTPPQSTITLTYYCVSILSLLGAELDNASQTTEWLIERQSSRDYGFQDISEYPNTLDSTAILTYYAVSALLITDPTLIEDGGLMDEEVWELSVSKGALAGIIIGVIGGILLLGAGYWKYRNRMKF